MSKNPAAGEATKSCSGQRLSKTTFGYIFVLPGSRRRYPQLQQLLLLMLHNGMSTHVPPTCAATLSSRTADCCPHHQHRRSSDVYVTFYHKPNRTASYPTKQYKDDVSAFPGISLSVNPLSVQRIKYVVRNADINYGDGRVSTSTNDRLI